MGGTLIFSEFSGGKAKKRGETKKLKSHRGKKRGGDLKKSRIWWGEQTLEDTMIHRQTFRLVEIFVPPSN